MHRFRKKSDARRSQVPPEVQGFNPVAIAREPLPALPPATDFRTSLILPDLSRRFTLLRSSTGDPIALDDMRSRFAEQRAKGAENTISEEEEEMLFEALNRMRAENAGADKMDDGEALHVKEDPASAPYTTSEFSHSETRQSSMSTTTTSSSYVHDSSYVSASPGSRSSKRHSNNLFGSGQFRDLRYMRQASNRNGSSRSVLSVTPSEMTTGSGANASAYTYADSLRPVTPENRTPSASVASSPNDKTPMVRSAPLQPPRPYNEVSARVTELRFSKPLTRMQLKRMSTSLEEVIREMEEDTDDKVLLPRSAASHQPHVSDAPRVAGSLSHEEDRDAPQTNSNEVNDASATLNWIAEDHPAVETEYRSSSPYRSPGAASPIPRIPGYIPGMPRPMTPHEMDSDDQRPNSTTPRATSPMSSYDRSTAMSPISATGMLRRGSNASSVRQTPRSGSPLTAQYPQRGENGRFTPEERQRNGDVSTDFGQPQDSSIIGRRRPASPLSGSAFQPMQPSSRPSTPSNVTWNVPPSRLPAQKAKPAARNGSVVTHSREGSSTSIADSYESTHIGSLDRSKSLTRSLRSPPLPDSPLIDSGHASVDYKGFSQSNGSFAASMSPISPSPIPAMEIVSPVIPTGTLHSPTPSHHSARSHTSPFTDNDPLRLNQRVASPLITPSSSPFSPRLQQPLVYSPVSNSSRSSLVSAGSSYHSWEEEHGGEGHSIALLRQSDPNIPAWHEFSANDIPKFDRASGSKDAPLNDSEIILRQFTGLTKGDLASIQGKLVEAAQNRTKNTEPRALLRRRRPSTAQSIHSLRGPDSRTTSPAPQSPTASSFPRAAADTTAKAKASALLDSVVDSIQAPVRVDTTAQRIEAEQVDATSPTRSDMSSPSRRNKDLADAIFGVNGPPTVEETPQPPDTPNPAPPPENQQKPLQLRPRSPESLAQVDVPVAAHYLQPGRSDTPMRSPTIDQTQLMKQVQEKADAAMAQLRKSPSQPKFVPQAGSAPRKRINLQDISSPRLFQSSTSIDKIPTIQSPPLTSPAPAAPEQRPSTKISSRISRKLRGTLRVKNPTPNGDEVSPWSFDSAPSSANQGPRYNLQKTSPPITISPPGSASTADLARSTAELGRFRSTEPSPPASAGPSLKNFMSRFRKRGQPDSQSETDRRYTPPSSQSPFGVSPPLISPVERGPRSPPASAPATNGASYASFHQSEAPPPFIQEPPPPARTPTLSQPGTTTVPYASRPGTATTDTYASRPSTAASDAYASRPGTATSDTHSPASPADRAALKQLYDAAENLGLDPGDLNEFLLSRSQSTASRSTTLTSNKALTRNHSLAFSAMSAPRESLDRARSPVTDRQTNQTPDPDRMTPLRSPTDQTHFRRPRETSDGQLVGGNSVVRRTLFFPSGNGSNSDLATLMRKASKSRRRASGTSMQSTRSVHDRVPTPPPPARAKRFSADPSPPVPRLPMSYSSQNQGGLLSTVPTAEAGLEKTSSNYESLYEMYAGDRASNSQVGEPAEPSRNPSVENIPNGDAGQAVEVIELANGETIWSIVNGLRTDDTDSVYHHRLSVASEFSAMSPNDSEAEQLFFKEHSRNASKGSNRSFLSRKKSAGAQAAANRPETKVFYSSSAQIARLIENLSRGADAGSFNIKPKAPPGHSHSSSLQSETDMHWTVEERLDHMLGSMGAPPS